MTTVQLLARVRTILDESTQAYFQDSAIYSALTDGQIEAINILYSIYKSKKLLNPYVSLPDALVPNTKIASSTTLASPTILIPTDSLFLVTVEATINSILTAALERDFSKESIFYNHNSLMNGTNDLTFYKGGTNLVFNQSVTGAYNIYYIQKPADIALGVDPVIGVAAHNAIVHYAAAFMLQQDQRTQESMQNFNLFIQLLREI